MTKPATPLPWPAGSVCPEAHYPDFASALKIASHHYADDSGKEWGTAGEYMKKAAEIAINASWPYWAMKRMYTEVAPLPIFDTFMEFYCRHLLVRPANCHGDLVEALEAAICQDFGWGEKCADALAKAKSQ